MNNGIESYNDTHNKCSFCSEIIPIGLVGSVNHWANCSGKEVTNDIKAVFNNPNGNMDDIKGVLRKHNLLESE